MITHRWVVVTDSNKAHIYSQGVNSHKEPLKLLHTLEHPDSRKMDHDLQSDRPGRYQAGGEAVHGAYVSRTDPKEVEWNKFAQEIAHILEQGRVQNQYEQLCIFAGPHFYGLMGMHMNKHVQDKITKVVQKDYLHLTENQLLDEINKK